ncbi:MAG TPA: hypothetical protein PLL33_03040 [Paracoccus sp. (in: a-proteobacteria)]|nr:hypothetical protein [Paracoccus sp. (in: a-proteobacteria)]
MSNPEPGLNRSRRWHRPAIIGLVVALLLAVIAMLIFAPLGSGDDDAEVEILAPGTDAPDPVPAPSETATGTAPAGTAASE